MAEADGTSIELPSLNPPENHDDDHSQPEATDTAEETPTESRCDSTTHKAQATIAKLSCKGTAIFLGVLIGIAAIFVAVWYGYPSLIIQQKSLDIQKWQANNDFRDQCKALIVSSSYHPRFDISDLPKTLANMPGASPECEQALKKPLQPPPLLHRSLVNLERQDFSSFRTRARLNQLSYLGLVASMMVTMFKFLRGLGSTILLSVTLSILNIIFTGTILSGLALILAGDAGWYNKSMYWYETPRFSILNGLLAAPPYQQFRLSLPLSYLVNLLVGVLLTIITAWSYGLNILVTVTTFGAGFRFAGRFRFRLSQQQYETSSPGINFAAEEEGKAMDEVNVSGGDNETYVSGTSRSNGKALAQRYRKIRRNRR
jgi:hypothetical protein